MIFNERLLVSNLNRFRICQVYLRNIVSNVSHSNRFFTIIGPSSRKVQKNIFFATPCFRNYAQPSNPISVTLKNSGIVQQTLIRGKAATEIQETLLLDFVNKHEEASPEEWKFLLDKILNLEHGMIHESNCDGRILDFCLRANKLHLARSYLHFIKAVGKKYNSAMACSFIKICYDLQESMIPEDFQKVQLFTKYLLSKYTVFDMITGDAVIKGLILCGMGEKSFQIFENMKETTAVSGTTFCALATYLLKNNEPDRALSLIKFIKESGTYPSKFYIEWIKHYKNDRRKIDHLLMFFQELDIKPTKSICDHLISVCKNFSRPFKLDGVYGHVNNKGQCSICLKSLNQIDLSEEEFIKMRTSFLQSAIVGNDVFQNTSPSELKKFISFVEKKAPFDIVLDGLNIAYMTGTHATHEVLVELTRNVIIHFLNRSNKILLIGRKHMMNWPGYMSALNNCNVDYFFIDNLSEDDLFIIYSALYSGLDSYFVTRDLLRSEKYCLSDDNERSLFKRWQQSHQIFITYVAPSGQIYTKAPLSFQMMTQKTSSGGWHIPYTDDDRTISKDEYGVHRQWLCLDNYLS